MRKFAHRTLSSSRARPETTRSWGITCMAYVTSGITQNRPMGVVTRDVDADEGVCSPDQYEQRLSEGKAANPCTQTTRLDLAGGSSGQPVCAVRRQVTT